MHIIKDREDIVVTRSGGSESVITKVAKTDRGLVELQREHAFLTLLADTGYVPRIVHADVSVVPANYSSEIAPTPATMIKSIVMEDVGESHEITNEYDFRTHLTRMLYYFRKHGVVHGDLTSANMRIVDNVTKVIDWGESRFMSEDRPDKRTGGDTFWAWHFASQWSDGARVARRWFAIYNAIVEQFGPAYIPDATLVDMGCFHGDVAAAASAAGMIVHGIDVDRQAIDVAKARWSNLPMTFEHAEVTTMGDLWRVDVVTILSMFPYVQQRYGIIVATRWLTNVIEAARMVFFESQLAGDGPGPPWMANNDRVQSFLENCGGREVEAVCEIALPDRHTTRTVFKVIGGGT